MSPLAQLRAEIGDTLLRIEITRNAMEKRYGKMSSEFRAAADARIMWGRLHSLVGKELKKELEQSKQPAKEVRP